ncbi:uncharacterized protein MEPE_01670 [Melanopsichium pennsylvanicum]|uniref:Uncharacterized protein n=2 Tax=Melanopsichium pennsylvanicum TaxID=63383 RepID=A0AAJ5C3Z0_9BASI|nr:upf0057 family protein [Melanopsichium pennsylvanicum 4]SNX82964.1 uncharacterized protein MEPE_01670 [Melanopsichium pennsylvanicum]
MAPKKSKGRVKKHHAFHGVIMVCGWLLPPLAVLIRFGVGLDLIINIFCTIAGYIPGHVHNFWIQNIRNNKNSRHSPSWAIKYGLVKDYRVKRTANGWSDRYGDGATEWRNQEIIVDPITGETRRDPESARKTGNVRSGSHFLAPWADNVDDSPRAEREDPYADERRQNAGRSGNMTRDPVTGAIIDGNDNGNGDTSGYDSLSRTNSRRSLGSRYAERYGIGAGTEASSRSSLSYGNDARESNAGSKWGRSNSSKPKKKDRWAREAEALGHPSQGSDNYSFDDNSRNYDGANSSRNRTSRIRDPLNDRHDF